MSKATDELQKTIVKRQHEKALIHDSAADHERSAIDADNAAAKLTTDAAAGDEKKQAAHTKLRGLADVHRQARDLENKKIPAKEAEIVEAQQQLLREQHLESAQHALDVQRDIATFGDKVRESCAGFSEPLLNLNQKIMGIFAVLEPLMDHTDAMRLRDRALEAVTGGVRAELNKNLKAAGIHLFGSLADGDFNSIVGPRLQDISNAISARMHSHAGASPVPGRKMYRALTNVAGLHGLNIKVGEVLSLDPDDPSVRRMVELNALEEIKEASGASA
jgi:hypothetical protein